MRNLILATLIFSALAATAAFAQSFSPQQKQLLIDSIYRGCYEKSSKDAVFQAIGRKRNMDVAKAYCSCSAQKSGAQLTPDDLADFMVNKKLSDAAVAKMKAVATGCQSVITG